MKYPSVLALSLVVFLRRALREVVAMNTSTLVFATIAESLAS